MEAVSVRDEDWRNSRKALKDRLEFLVNNEFASDIKFTLKTGDKIFAHKFPLSVASPVFAAMFHGALATKEDVIKILDCDRKEIFVEFLKYLYSEQCKLNWDNVFDILYLAKKYLVSTLVEVCVKFLSQDISINNALSILQQANKFGEKALKQKCMKFLCPNVREILKTKNFIHLDRDTLKVILERDELDIREIELFKFIEAWCDHKLSCSKKAGDPNAKRDMLGDVLYLIRFPVMSAAEFAENCAKSGFVSVEECCNIFCYISRKTGCATEDHKLASELISQHGFSGKERQPSCWGCYSGSSVRCYSRAGRSESGWNYFNDQTDAIRFSVSQAIKLQGVTIFGNLSTITMHDFYVIDVRNNSKLNTGLVKSHKLSTNGPKSPYLSEDSFIVAFEKELDILPRKKYDICAKLSGPPSKGGHYESQTNPVGSIFTFYDSGRSSNGTSAASGQFPEVWYTHSEI